ncbi:hypothetical protein ABTD62_21325, partial [Acinetobacter baumannii]
VAAGATNGGDLAGEGEIAARRPSLYSAPLDRPFAEDSTMNIWLFLIPFAIAAAAIFGLSALAVRFATVFVVMRAVPAL